MEEKKYASTEMGFSEEALERIRKAEQARFAAGESSPSTYMGILDHAARIERRMKAYRFATCILFVLLTMFALLVDTYSREMAAATTQLRQANEHLRQAGNEFQTDRDNMRACQAQIAILEGARAAAIATR
jgi:hypothetical protein